MLVWEFLAECKRRWAAFTSDPEFKAEFVAAEKAGVMVASVTNTILAPTRFSTMQ